MAQVNIKVDYDKEADVLYITFGTREPSYCEEVDDILLVERGFITNRITGFRILDLRLHRVRLNILIGVKIDRILKQEKFPCRSIYMNALKEKFASSRLSEMISSQSG